MLVRFKNKVSDAKIWILFIKTPQKMVNNFEATKLLIIVRAFISTANEETKCANVYFFGQDLSRKVFGSQLTRSGILTNRELIIT